jgi:phospholipid/cholesterol/gamma-HCH transport system substrate-binding protein
MVSKAQKFRMGLFVLICSVLLIIFLVSVAGNRLMEKRDVYYIHYENVSIIGLQVGGSVKYHGISIGRVDEITIDPNDVQRIIVKISIQEGTPIKEDLEAALSPVGITGLMQIELSGGTNEARTLTPGSKIKSGESFLQNMSGKAEIITEKIDKLLDNFNELTNAKNQQRISSIIENVDTFVAESKQPIGNIITNADSTIIYLNLIASDLATTMQRITTIMESNKIDTIIDNTEKVSSDLAKINYDETLGQLNELITTANATMEHIDVAILNSQQDLKISIETMREVMDNLNDFTRQLTEDPTILWRSRRQ